MKDRDSPPIAVRSGMPRARLPGNRRTFRRATICHIQKGAVVSPEDSAGTLIPAEREARWELSVRFAIEAISEAEARAITGQVLARLDQELPSLGEPTVAPLRLRDGVWVATLKPDLTVLSSIEPDDARTRCNYVVSHFGERVTWTTRDSEHGSKWDWPPDIWSRQPGQDDVLLHPAVQAVVIWCEAKEA